jgi:hypothetical protein
MARFIDVLDDHCDMVNLDHVVTIRTRHTDKGVTRHDLLDGNGHMLGHIHGKLIADDLCGGLIPAPADYMLVSFWHVAATDECGVIQDPILAFIVGKNEATPITLDGYPLADEWAIKEPSGRLVNPYDRNWKDVAEFKEYHLLRAREALEREKVKEETARKSTKEHQ